jgi:fibro-slime domain-containing protein
MLDRVSSPARGRLALAFSAVVLFATACGDAAVRGQGTDPSRGPSGPTDNTIALPDAGIGAPSGPPRSTGPAACGNGQLEGSEACDDGNDKGGDGCSATCTVESGFSCSQPGLACTGNARCGDRGVSGKEQCDDGNDKAGDGCAPDCKLENGWVCPPGGVCQAARCGDGLRVGRELCDDGNDKAGDGCNSNCLVESPAAAEADGWMCPTAGEACKRTTCGNGMAEGSEQCDDGNNDLGDGCSPFCRREPQCPAAGGACNTACGDGLLLPADMAQGQTCDDGNTLGGDGCSADCKLEPGFNCMGMPVAQDPLQLPIIYRDFKGFDEPGGHPDFQRFIGAGEFGIAQSMLGPAGKPVHDMNIKRLTVNNDGGFAGTDYFGIWWKDDPKYNKTIRELLTLNRVPSGAFQFSATGFFPLENRGFGTYMGTAAKGGGYRNFHFTSEVRHWFEYRGNERLDFTGDDDMFVFINKRLVVDLGGVHMALTGSLTLDAQSGDARVCDLLAPCPAGMRTVNLGLRIGSVYEIAVFQAERRTDESNYRLSLANFNGTRTSCKSVCGDGIQTPDEACDLGKDKNVGQYGTCNPDCTLTDRCGDGVTGPGEECDGGPGCSSTCKRISID